MALVLQHKLLQLSALGARIRARILGTGAGEVKDDGAGATAQAAAAVCIGGEHQRRGLGAGAVMVAVEGGTAPVRGPPSQAVMMLLLTGFLAVCQAVSAVRWRLRPAVKGYRQDVHTLDHL